ncbi:MAG TPA: hypothetical protein VE503_09915 [Ornithinibacter sp.]|jgi:photosystem II stability/assembly factor-like uncharacterized protein|nr:hypothetical protein [Ornithinibacter sp.]
MELRRVAPIVGLCALLVADLVLIVLAFRPSVVQAGGRGAPDAASPSSTSSPSASGSSAAPSPGAGVKAVPVERFVTAVSATAAWVVEAGSCAEPGRLWVTSDAGDSWSQEELPGRVLRARPDSATEAFITGGDEKCDLRLWRTVDGGAAWGEPQSAAEAWSRSPEDAKAVHTPADELEQPCAGGRVLDLTGLGAARASVLCDNGDLRSTTDGGGTWAESATVKGGLALTLTETGTGAVVRTDASCQGVVVVPVTIGKPKGEGTCVKAAVAQGKVSISASGKGWWLLVGDRLHSSPDANGPWKPTGEDLTS